MVYGFEIGWQRLTKPGQQLNVFIVIGVVLEGFSNMITDMFCAPISVNLLEPAFSSICLDTRRKVHRGFALLMIDSDLPNPKKTWITMTA